MADVRPSGTSSSSTCWKIEYNSRSDTAEIMPSRWRSSIVAGQRQVQHYGTRQAYIARRTAEGKTIREIKRCLKRYITRQLYRTLTATMTPTTNNPVVA